MHDLCRWWPTLVVTIVVEFPTMVPVVVVLLEVVVVMEPCHLLLLLPLTPEMFMTAMLGSQRNTEQS
jgi:hypothetical protein